MQKYFYILSSFLLLAFVVTTPVQAATSSSAQETAPLQEDVYSKPTMAKSIIDYFGYHNDQFYSGVTWDVYHTISEHRDQVYAPLSGEIVKIGSNDALGIFLVIKHNEDLSSLLGNLGTINVNEGDHVSTKQFIAKVDKDQPLYHEVTYNEVPVDPSSVIGFKAADFPLFHTEAIDEIETGPYTLIANINFDEWEDLNPEVYTAAAAAAGGGAAGNSRRCDSPGSTRDHPSGNGLTERCCEVPDMEDGAGYWVSADCSCPVFRRVVNSRIHRNRVEEQIIRAHPFGQRTGSILDMMCWDQFAAIKGQAGKAYKAPEALVGPFRDLDWLINEYASPVVQAWREGFWAEGADITNLPGLVVLSYMRAQQFLDRAVQLINNAVKSFVGALLNSLTGGFLSSLGLEKQFSCDMMYRLWNAVDNCTDIDLPEIGDLLDRIELPGLPCALEQFAYGGSGVREARDMLRRPVAPEYQFNGLNGIINGAQRAQDGLNDFNSLQNQGGWDGRLRRLMPGNN